MTTKIIHGDNLTEMRKLLTNSVDAVVTDPPYFIGFMGKEWDGAGKSEPKTFQEFSEEWAREAIRVLKPGGHLLSFASARTYHRMVCGLEDAGFEIRDQIMWVFGSGFPKSLDVSKAIDGHVTSGRSDSLSLKEVNETRPGEATVRPTSTNGHRGIVGSADAGQSIKRATPATPQGEQWEGWGTALKPAHEPICVARKPLVGTVAANVLAFGTGALNIDGCRVATDDSLGGGAQKTVALDGKGEGWQRPWMHDKEAVAAHVERVNANVGKAEVLGRWPANLIHDGSDEVLAAFPDAGGAQGRVKGTEPTANGFSGAVQYGGMLGRIASAEPRVEIETSAARFYYCAKASRADRNTGLVDPGPQFKHGATLRKIEDAPKAGNVHPTVKPTDLMAYLCRLVTPPGGVVLDPFMGSGSTGKACAREGFDFIGIELEAEYLAIATARIEHEHNVVAAAAAQAAIVAAPAQRDMFGASA